VKEFFNLTWKYWVMFLLLSAAVQAAWYYLMAMAGNLYDACHSSQGLL
jgi:hypothetical protein